MASYAGTYTGPPSTYGGTATFTPSSEESSTELLALLSLLGNGSQTAASASGGNTVASVEGLIASLGQVGMAAAEIMASDGVLTPYALAQAGIGLAGAWDAANSLWNGTGTGGSQSGMSSTEQAQLGDVWNRTGGVEGAGVALDDAQVDAIAAAVWDILATQHYSTHADFGYYLQRVHQLLETWNKYGGQPAGVQGLMRWGPIAQPAEPE